MRFTSILSAAALAISSVQAGSVHDRAAVGNDIANVANGGDGGGHCSGGSTWSGFHQSCRCETGQTYQNSECGFAPLPKQTCSANQAQFCAQDQSNYCAYDPNHAYCLNNGKNIAFCSNTENVQETTNSYWNMGVTVINN